MSNHRWLTAMTELAPQQFPSDLLMAEPHDLKTIVEVGELRLSAAYIMPRDVTHLRQAGRQQMTTNEPTFQTI